LTVDLQRARHNILSTTYFNINNYAFTLISYYVVRMIFRIRRAISLNIINLTVFLMETQVEYLNIIEINFWLLSFNVIAGDPSRQLVCRHRK
jgi:hypothetical protein